VVTSLLVVEGNGVVGDQAGGYSDWEARGGKLREITETHPAAKTAEPASAPTSKPAAPRPKLSYKDQRELDALPKKIEALEQRQAELEAAIADPGFYQQEREATEPVLAGLAEVQEELEAAMERWMELEDK